MFIAQISNTNQATSEGSPENARTGSFCGYCSGWLVRKAKSSRFDFPAPFLVSPFWESKKVKPPVGNYKILNRLLASALAEKARFNKPCNQQKFPFNKKTTTL
jgi:hypothetical protein